MDRSIPSPKEASPPSERGGVDLWVEVEGDHAAAVVHLRAASSADLQLSSALLPDGEDLLAADTTPGSGKARGPSSPTIIRARYVAASPAAAPGDRAVGALLMALDDAVRWSAVARW